MGESQERCKNGEKSMQWKISGSSRKNILTEHEGSTLKIKIYMFVTNGLGTEVYILDPFLLRA